MPQAPTTTPDQLPPEIAAQVGAPDADVESEANPPAPEGAADDSAPQSDTALPDGDTPDPRATLAATVDDEGNVLELIYSNRDGVYVRDNGTWSLIDDNEQQPTIDDQEWLEVTPDFVPAFDDMMQTQDTVSREDAAKYAVSQDYDTPAPQ